MYVHEAQKLKEDNICKLKGLKQMLVYMVGLARGKHFRAKKKCIIVTKVITCCQLSEYVKIITS